ncbi:3-deoxy-7-phosphoheptulonate synthase [Desulforamulus hydrothermalis]|uniref:3-deoxy-D-arabinoheptulosonate-7-phosphate synthase n=1 Tax=Desulforamulus hydrothermalis Lam5 = DSM 18033 TaxID=1121428 RepID=K8E0E5_9FIRM|nr:3-deoxy-7-phosphoheptulonate synthase [Desulforamulus hydrothermalis]CCO09012.1 3-deoxy-D-arabinoheptulosonate-7-phosphate synthase [Desulforamulus hydrothermalis Lam5 = DSM 18033]SHG76894.1 3-deoxy-D-arabinoheptulosonate-7-phosphate synthase [Desulforamulus hydrothermalis Lam5 = DSM 18033]
MSSDRLVSRKNRQADTVVKVGPAAFGGGNFSVVAGPCAVENRDELIQLALQLKASGVQMLRGGVFKPRTSPYSFQGLGREGLQFLAEARAAARLPVVTEVLDVRDLDLVLQYADMIQIGSRNMQNFGLLREVGRVKHPVLLKRGLSATIEEWLLAAEYILAEGNHQVVLCERGIRTFETATRNTLDISAIPLVKQLSHLPVMADPSHATGRRDLVVPVARAAVLAGADGLLLEVHPAPERALSDGAQSLQPQQLASFMNGLPYLLQAREKCQAAI